MLDEFFCRAVNWLLTDSRIFANGEENDVYCRLFNILFK